MSFDVRTLAIQKSGQTQYSELEWLRALESARQSLKFIAIDYQSLELIAQASQSPGKFTVMARLIYQYGKTYPNADQLSDAIFEFVNDSPFALSDWIDALEYFYGWLEQNGRKVDFLAMLKYLQCCVASPDAREGGQTLISLVKDMLAVCDYEG